jgi:hypothetical protein
MGTMNRRHEHRQTRSKCVDARSNHRWPLRALVGGAIGIWLVFAVSVPAFAANPTIVTDPVGDALHKAPGYMDIVGAQLTDSSGTFQFEMTVAEPIPASPALPPPATKQISWHWLIDTDPTTAPAGSPLAPGHTGRPELIVTIAWNGSAFSAFLHDRRPLLTGGQPIFTPLAFTISQTVLRVDVQANALGNPSSFSWGGVTIYWSGPFDGNDGNHLVDELSPFFTPAP